MHADHWPISLTSDKLEESMVIAPKPEANLFMNRDKFDIVAVCDQDSKLFAADKSPLSILVEVISEQAFKKMLKRMPMLVVGGFAAWKKEFGEDGLARDEIDGFFVPPASPSLTLPGVLDTQHQDIIAASGSLHSPKPIPSSNNPFVVNGSVAGAPTSPPVDTLVQGTFASPSTNPFRTSPNIFMGGVSSPSISLSQKPSNSRCVLDAR